MKRQLNCVFCRRALPAGCRIDKKYCDQKCTELAYYDRHPDKRAKKLAKLRKAGPATGQPRRRPDSPADLVARVEDAQEATQREISALGDRLIHLESLFRSQSRERQNGEVAATPAIDISVSRKVAKLKLALQKEAKRATDAEQTQTNMQRQIEEMQEELRLRGIEAGEHAEKMANALEEDRRSKQRIRELETALQQKPAVASTQAPPPRDERTSRSALSSAAPIQRPKLPWERLSEEAPYTPIARFENFALELRNKIADISDTALAAVPGQLWKHGDRKQSQVMREWIAARQEFIQELSYQLVAKIISTPPQERQSAQQKKVLAEVAIEDTIEFFKGQQPDSAAQIEQDFIAKQDLYDVLALQLVYGCAGEKLKHY